MPASLRGRCGLTIAEIAKLTGATLTAAEVADRRIGNIAPLCVAGAADITFLDDEKCLGELAATRAGACLMPPRFAASAPPGLIALLTDEPYRAFVAAARALFPEALLPSSLFATSGRAAAAQVHGSARIEAGATIDPLAVIGPRARIGAGTLIAVGAAVGPDVCIGRQCAVGAGATVMNALIGDRVLIQSGARLGEDGFGHLSGSRRTPRLPPTGRVIIQDDVEIGANAAVARGSLRDTVIGEGSKIDNLVQIAHNVRIGRHCLIAAQTGIADSVTVGDFVVIGAQVGIAHRVAIGDGAVLAAQSRVSTDIPGGAHFGEAPAEPLRAGVGGTARTRREARSTRKPDRNAR
jgi:UDP-3-O-[3-hydroxymyristoyl] glucosamine N-acyltransferase